MLFLDLNKTTRYKSAHTYVRSGIFTLTLKYIYTQIVFVRGLRHIMPVRTTSLGMSFVPIDCGMSWGEENRELGNCLCQLQLFSVGS